MIRIRKAVFQDAIDILPLLRIHDQKTIKRLGLDPISLLRQTFESRSPIFVATADGEPACMWGFEKKSMLSAWVLWMLTTETVDRHPVKFLRESRRIVKEFSAANGTIEGLVDSSFETSVHWLRWIGFHPVEDGEFIRMRYP